MIPELTDKNWNKEIEGVQKPVFIDFYSPMCGPCNELGQFLDNNLLHYAKTKDVLVFKCNVSKNPKIADKFKIQSVPFTIGIKKGKFVHPNIGLQGPDYYYGVIDKLAKTDDKKRFFGLF